MISTRTAGPVQQIPNQPRQANTLDLRYCTTNQAPAKSSKSLALLYSKPSANRFKQIRLQSTQTKHRPVPANATDLRSAGVPLPPACAYLHVRPWSCAHGHGHTFTGMGTATSTSGHASVETSGPVHTDQAPIQPTQNTWGAWASTATAASIRRPDVRGGQHACVIGLSGLKARLQSSLKA